MGETLLFFAMTEPLIFLAIGRLFLAMEHFYLGATWTLGNFYFGKLRHKLDQTCKTCSKWIKLVQTGSNLPNLVKMDSNMGGLEIFLAIAGPEIFLAMGEVFFTCLQLRLLAICATWTFGKLDFG